MLVPLADALRVVSSHPRFPAELIASEPLNQISAIAAALPSVMDAFGFECRLAEGDGRVDFGMQITGRSGGREKLVLLIAGDGGPSGPAAAPWRRRLADFCAEWAAPESLLYWRIASLFLEFDVVDPFRAVGEPSVFLQLEPAIRGVGEAGVGVPEGLDWLTECAFDLLSGARSSQASREAFVCAVEALPSRGRIVHVASMRARGSDAIRVYASLPIGLVGGYLASLGWPGDLGEVEEVCERYATQRSGATKSIAAIQFELGPALAPRIGVEFSSFHLSPEERQDDWAWLLELLVADGLCSKRKSGALLRWPGTLQEKLTPTSWPCAIVHELSHVKVVVGQNRPRQAKAYLTIEPRFSLFKEELAVG